jgi:hypothetical protein
MQSEELGVKREGNVIRVSIRKKLQQSNTPNHKLSTDN